MEKMFEGGKSIHTVLDEAIAHCRSHNMPLPYVIVLVPANGGVSVVWATEKRGDPIFRLPPEGGIVASPITVLIVDAQGGTAHFELSEAGDLTLH